MTSVQPAFLGSFFFPSHSFDMPPIASLPLHENVTLSALWALVPRGEIWGNEPVDLLADVNVCSVAVGVGARRAIIPPSFLYFLPLLGPPLSGVYPSCLCASHDGCREERVKYSGETPPAVRVKRRVCLQTGILVGTINGS